MRAEVSLLAPGTSRKLARREARGWLNRAGAPDPGPLPAPDAARPPALDAVVLFAVGEGVFLTGSAVFFTQIVGLSAAQVGLGLTVAGVVSFFFAVPMGKLADRIGPQADVVLGSVGGAAVLYLVWPLINGFP